MLVDKTFEVVMMSLSLVIVCASYLLVVWKDKSWINWTTPAFFLLLGGRYFFQFLYLLWVGPGGSHYAYFFCYATFALTFLSGALTYVFIKPLKFRVSPKKLSDNGFLPWFLLLWGFLLYLPILIEFRDYLTQPRRIYELTRTGYGAWSYGSTTFLALAFVTYLFSPKKTTLGAIFFYLSFGILSYLHGSKGQLILSIFIWMIYNVYVRGKSIRAFAALATLSIMGVLVLGLFAAFSSPEDLTELVLSVTSYSDYVRNAMLVIDDDHGKIYWGRLTLENEFYSRVPRAIMPSKPKDFGPFLLAKIYNPPSYRNDEGVGAFDIGVQYADFGPFSMIWLCLGSAGMAWMVSSLKFYLRSRPSPSAFVVFLFFVGLGVVPLSGAFYLPETLFLAGSLSLASKSRFFRNIKNQTYSIAANR